MQLSSYDGILEEAIFQVNGKSFGPIKIPLFDYHSISQALTEARLEGRKSASNDLMEAMQFIVSNISQKVF